MNHSARDGRALVLKLLAPWISVAVFWVVFENGWLALLGYHLQIALWNRQALSAVFGGLVVKRLAVKGLVQLVLPALLAGPAMYLLLPYIIEGSLSEWLARYQLSGWALVMMIPYFGLIHPLLEQIHWAPLRDKTALAHILFAGYHVLVLFTLLPVIWLLIAFIVLCGASVFWQQLIMRNGGLALPCLSHIAADSTIVLAAYCLTL